MRKRQLRASRVGTGEFPGTPGQRSSAGPGGRGGWWEKAHFPQHGGGSLIFVGRETLTATERLCFSSSRNDIAMSHYFLAPQGQEAGGEEEGGVLLPGKPPNLMGKVSSALAAGKMGRGFLTPVMLGLWYLGVRSALQRQPVNTRSMGPCPPLWRGAGYHARGCSGAGFHQETFPSPQLCSTILCELGGFNE